MSLATLKHYTFILSMALIVPACNFPEFAVAVSPVSKTTVKKTSNGSDEDLFDSHMLRNDVRTKLVSHQTSEDKCVPPANLIAPESVFSPSPSAPDPSTQPLTQSPSDPPVNVSNSTVSSSIDRLSPGQGTLTAQNSAPAFLGDFFIGGRTTITGLSSSSPFEGVSLAIASPNSVGMMKMAENTSPLPRDRVFTSYNYFDNVNLIPGGLSVHRYTPGFEKTFLNGLTSVEVRVPMAITLNSTTNVLDLDFDTNQYELGNLTTFFKVLLYANEQYALSAGMGIAAPTADDLRIRSGVEPLVVIENHSWHLLPFIGSVYTPNDKWFFQSMMQFDFAANGNPVFTSFEGDLTKQGELNEPAFLFGSFGAGFWIYSSDDPSAHFSKVALMSELHLNSSLQKTDTIVDQNDTQIGTQQDRMQSINGIVGTNLMFGQNKSLSVGYVVPIGGGNDQIFDGEFRAMFNWYFGNPINQLSRVQY